MKTELVRRLLKTKDAYDWLSHQVGTETVVRVQTSPYRAVPETIFTLLGFGRTWQDAEDMAGKSK